MLLSAVTILVLLQSCSTENINDRWSLMSSIEGFTGHVTTYQEGEITWEFNSVEEQVIITNNVDNNSLSSGIYSYELIEELTEPNGNNSGNSNTFIYIDDIKHGSYSSNESSMVISSLFVDGPEYRFIKIND